MQIINKLLMNLWIIMLILYKKLSSQDKAALALLEELIDYYKPIKNFLLGKRVNPSQNIKLLLEKQKKALVMKYMMKTELYYIKKVE